jgi:molybdate transport system substrate-binding protein
MKLAVVALALVACSREPTRISVGAAASLRHAMPELVAAFKQAHGIDVAVTYGASDTLAADVERGAAFDAIALADGAAVDKLADRIVADTRRTVATTTIVLVGPAGAELKFSSLAKLHAGTTIAIGDPATVPAGRYARQYLESLGVWSALQDQLVFGGDVAGVLALAKQGRARLAIVYRTDAVVAAPLVILDAPADAPTASIVSAVAARSHHAGDARAFCAFLASPQGQNILADHGFSAPPAPDRAVAR